MKHSEHGKTLCNATSLHTTILSMLCVVLLLALLHMNYQISEVQKDLESILKPQREQNNIESMDEQEYFQEFSRQKRSSRWRDRERLKVCHLYAENDASSPTYITQSVARGEKFLWKDEMDVAHCKMKTSPSSGAIESIVISLAGSYYVYSRVVYWTNNNGSEVGHQILRSSARNDHPTVIVAITTTPRQPTTYFNAPTVAYGNHGGTVVRLSRGDRVWVEPLKQNTCSYRVKNKESYFGIFKLF